MRKRARTAPPERDLRRGRPSERLDPKAKHRRAGKLAETAGLLHQADRRRHRGGTWSNKRSSRIDRARCESANSKRKRGDERDALRRKHVAIDEEAAKRQASESRRDIDP